MWIDYGRVYFNDVDGNVIEKEELARDDDDFDDCRDDYDDYYDDYDDDETKFFNNEMLELERRIEEAMKGEPKIEG